MSVSKDKRNKVGKCCVCKEFGIRQEEVFMVASYIDIITSKPTGQMGWAHEKCILGEGFDDYGDGWKVATS